MAKLKEEEAAHFTEEEEKKRKTERKTRLKETQPQGPDIVPIKETKTRRRKTSAESLPPPLPAEPEPESKKPEEKHLTGGDAKISNGAEKTIDVPSAEPPPPPPPTVSVTTQETYSPPIPKHSYGYLASQPLTDLRKIGRELNASGHATLRKDDLIISVLRAQAESMNYKFGGGTLEILPEGFGFLRPKGMLPTDSDVYLSVSQIRRFGLRNGDVIWGLIRPPREQEHYEALLRVETVNFSDPEQSRKRALFGQLTPVFPNEKNGPGKWAQRVGHPACRYVRAHWDGSARADSVASQSR